MVPRSTANASARKRTFTPRNAPSRLTAASSSERSRTWSQRRATSVRLARATITKKARKYGPTGPSPKACTEEITPERMRNVPRSVSENVSTIRSRFQALSMRRRSCTWTLWMNAVAVSHGMMETFSTGSHAQKPPQPSTS